VVCQGHPGRNDSEIDFKVLLASYQSVPQLYVFHQLKNTILRGHVEFRVLGELESESHLPIARSLYTFQSKDSLRA
jgi:hypothetical protein